MLYPSVSDAVNRKHQSRAVAGYAEEVEQLSDADYQAYFDAADAYNRQLNTTPNAFYKPDLVSGYLFVHVRTVLLNLSTERRTCLSLFR